MIQNSNQCCYPLSKIGKRAKCSESSFICLYLLVFVYGAAPAEARYNISGVRKAGVAVLRSVLNKTRLLTTFLTMSFFRIRKLEIMNVST